MGGLLGYDMEGNNEKIKKDIVQYWCGSSGLMNCLPLNICSTQIFLKISWVKSLCL